MILDVSAAKWTFAFSKFTSAWNCTLARTDPITSNVTRAQNGSVTRSSEVYLYATLYLYLYRTTVLARLYSTKVRARAYQCADTVGRAVTYTDLGAGLQRTLATSQTSSFPSGEWR